MNGVERCHSYADGVISGEILAPSYIRLACERFKADLDREDIYFDERAANAAVRNVERLKHAKGRWQGKPLTLEAWQCFLMANLFGWKWTKNDLRRFRYAYLQVPRKNGKTLSAIGVALNMLGPDREPGSEVYLGATSQEQAKNLLFSPAKFIVEQCPDFREHFGIEVNASSLVIPANFSQLKPVIKKPDDGANPHCAVVDEYHEHEDSTQWDTFDTGMGAREQPLLLTITTAGSRIGGPCHEYRDQCIKILEGADGDSTFVMVYEPDEDDAWDDPQTLYKVNPNIDVSVSADYLKDQLEAAKRSASKQNSFKTKHLNMWVGSRSAWLNMLAWHKQRREMTLDSMRGLPCMMAVDLSSKTDLAALSVMFRDRDEYSLFSRMWAPAETIRQNEQYRKLKDSGDLIETPGSTTDYAFIEEEINAICGRHDVKHLGFDPWQAQYLAQRLARAGLDGYEYRQTVGNMSEPMKELEKLVLDGKLYHSGNKALTWCMGNVMCRYDEKGNIYPTKDTKDSPNKIDGAVSSIMCMGLWLQQPDDGFTDNFGVVAL